MYDDDDDNAGFDDETRVCPVTGRREKKTLISVLNKKGRLSKFEMDEIFLEDE